MIQDESVLYHASSSHLLDQQLPIKFFQIIEHKYFTGKLSPITPSKNKPDERSTLLMN